MKKLFFFLITISFHVISFSQSLSEKLSQYFEAAQKAEIFNGSVMVAKGGNVLINKGFGFKNADAKTLNDSNTIYQIGSVTKQFTSTIILKLAEQGKLSLNDKLSKYFPDLPYAKEITIENLLTHTSGIYNYTNDTSFMQHDVEKAVSQQKIISMFKDKPLEFTPGSKFSYSNSGYMLLGYIIEKVTGKKYEKVVRENIFNPLGMTNSGFDFTHLNNTNRATGYDVIPGTASVKSMIVDSSVSFAAGAVYSTSRDMYKWNQSLLTEKILKKASLENAFKPRLSKYGLGLAIDTIEGKRIITHNGGIHGFLSHNTIIPADSISITILSNAGSANMGQIQKDVFSILYNKPYKLPEVHKAIAVNAAVLQQYAGEYELSPAFIITITLVDGSLKAQATGQPQFDLFAESENRFFLKVVDAQVEFVKNGKGEVDKLILHQNGQHLPGKKIK